MRLTACRPAPEPEPAPWSEDKEFFASVAKDIRISGARPAMVLYISGPMTGIPEFNYPAFREAAKGLRVRGWSVIDPSENFGGRSGFPRHKYLAADVLALVQRCSGIVLLDGWTDSEGAKLEAQIALNLGYGLFRYNPWMRGLLSVIGQAEMEMLLA